jgi:integrase
MNPSSGRLTRTTSAMSCQAVRLSDQGLQGLTGVPEPSRGDEARLRALPRHHLAGMGQAQRRELQAEACHPSARQVGRHADQSEYARRRAATADRVGDRARIQREQSLHPRSRLETNPEGARPWPSWAFKLIDETGREDIKRAVLLARYTGQRQADVLRMNHKDIEDGGILVTQQKTGKELWVPLHPALKDALEGWSSSPYVVNRRGEPYTPERFRGVWAHVMEYTPAGRIREEGFVFHGLRASACEKLREAGCGDREIEAITGMSPDMVTRYSRFADQKRLAKAAAEKLARL